MFMRTSKYTLRTDKNNFLEKNVDTCFFSIICYRAMKYFGIFCGIILIGVLLDKFSVKAEKAGYCPPAEVDAMGGCPDQCSDDYSCKGVSKCCKTICGLSCQEPMNHYDS